MNFELFNFPENISEDELKKEIQNLNENKNVS